MNAASLSNRNHHCTHEMIAATEAIMNNPFADNVQAYIRETKVRPGIASKISCCGSIAVRVSCKLGTRRFMDKLI